MAQHISIRVPWHDDGWKGTICNNPVSNTSCLRLKRIKDDKDDNLECSLCGKCMAGNDEKIPCISEGGAFMSSIELHQSQIHPYKKRNLKTHGHFKETSVVYPPYSFPCKPFAWMRYSNNKNHSYDKAINYGIDYDATIEPELGFDAGWVQEAKNHRAIFDYFYQDIVADKSLCIAYAKQVPFVDDSRRVIIGIGHVKKIVPAVEHEHSDEGTLRSMTWETMICHSIRENHADGFVIPYQKMMKYAESHPDFDISSITVFAPEDAFSEFSFVTEHVNYDSVIDVLLSCKKAFTIIDECLDEDYGNVIKWIDNELQAVWKDRGAFPGLGSMLTAFGIKLGIPLAREIKNNIANTENLWSYLDEVLKNPQKYLSPKIANSIDEPLRNKWIRLSNERRNVFELFSRFSLNINQAKVLFDDRKQYDIDFTDKDIIENPYIIYEKTRLKLKNSDLYFSVEKIDRAIFPVEYIANEYPLKEPTRLKGFNDERRIRAIAISVLEEAIEEGHTFLPVEELVLRIKNLNLDPVCEVSLDMINAIENFMRIEIMKREMKDGTEYYKLVRINRFDEIIEKVIRKRMQTDIIEMNVNWRKMIDDRFGSSNIGQELEELARQEKTAVLKVLAESKISVLVGDAGTGKTAVLSVLCSEPSISAGGVLLLAPTGKATVRLMESVNASNNKFEAKNIAQFLSQSGRFSNVDMRYRLSDKPCENVPETVIVDEASMLTEEMFGALIQAIIPSKRIIFVGDPNQLPPIGAGKPFVDLVNVLKEKLPLDRKYDEPCVCKCYGELRINRRQQNESDMLDIQFAKLFTYNNDFPDREGVLSSILNNKSERIKIKKWSNVDELEKLILNTISEETTMNNPDDYGGFNKSVGASISDGKTSFGKESVNAINNWQILIPVKNMAYGVININGLIHKKYRYHELDIVNSKENEPQKIISYGPESIVYGDKVINIRNQNCRAIPYDSNANNYVANGEIGIVTNNFGKLKVCFSSQPKYEYEYTNNVKDDGNAVLLELAYALTVHKAQGSQFDVVIFVLPEPCRIISREMLYTALTRQVKKVIILYNNDPYKIMNYSLENYSEISSRLTDLFADVFPDDDGMHKPQAVKVNNKIFNDGRIHRTIRGEMVRSKSEVIIANALYNNNVNYEYEAPLQLEDYCKSPDFKIIDDLGNVWYWEHFGMMSNPSYAKSARDKEAFYRKNGIMRDKNLIVTEEYNYEGLDSKQIDDLVKEYFC